jgi:hypothetical protein
MNFDATILTTKAQRTRRNATQTTAMQERSANERLTGRILGILLLLAVINFNRHDFVFAEWDLISVADFCYYATENCGVVELSSV